MGGKIRTYFNTLKGTITLLLSLAMTLGLIMGIAATANAIRTASEQIYLTNRNELETYMTAVDNEFEKIKEEINIVIEDYWFFYRGLENNDCFEVYDFIQNLKKLRIRNDGIKAIFTLSELETVPDWIGYDSNDISYAEGTVIKNALKNGLITAEKTREIQIIQIEQSCYICYYVYNLSGESCIGVIYDIKDLLDDLSGGSEESRSYFMDKEGNLYGISGREDLLESNNALGNEGPYFVGDYVGIVENSKSAEFSVVRLMARNDIMINPSKSYLVFLLMAVLIIMMNPVIGMALDHRVYKSLGRLHNAMQEIEHDNLDFRMEETESTEEFEYTKKVFNTMADEIKTLRIKAYEEEIERLQIEARNLRLQVSPHMLQNSLNIIYNLSLSNNNKVIQKFVPCLSDYFRYSLEKHGELVPIKNEIEFVDNYLKVQKIRFPDRILFVYDVNKELAEAMVPPLQIQNFVENTVKYGLKAEEEIEIIIVIKEGKLPFQRHLNEIMDYTFFWIISIYEHYLTFGDFIFLKQIFTQLEAVMNYCLGRVDADGFMRKQEGDWIFIDWALMDVQGALCGEQILFAKAMECYSFICRQLGCDDKNCGMQAELLQDKIQSHYFDREKKVFIDSFESGKRNVSRQSNILAYLFLPCSKEQKESIYQCVINNPEITAITTLYFKFYENQVRCEAGEIDLMQIELENYYGGMIDIGATTFFEEFDPTQRGAEHYAMYGAPYEKSLCHAWSASPVYLLGAYRMGVKNTGIVFEHYEVRPSLGSLTDFKGKVPVPGGIIEVEMNREEVCMYSDIKGGSLILNNHNYPIPAREKLRVRI